MSEVKVTRLCRASWSWAVSFPRETARSVEVEHAAAVLDGGRVDLDSHDVDPVAGEHLDDAGAHGAQTDHTNFAEVTSHAGESVRARMPREGRAA